MQIRVGYELAYECPQATPMILMLNIHFSHASDIIVPDRVVTEPSLPVTAYRDSFGNWCSRIVAPAGQTWIHGRAGQWQRGRRGPRGAADARRASTRRHARVSPGQPLLRNRPLE